MVANGQSRTNSLDEDVTMVPIHDDVIMEVRNTSCSSTMLGCPHCDFKCDSTSIMTQHSWEQHPLLMRRKKHLINTSKPENCDETLKSSDLSQKALAPVVQTAQEMQNCYLSGSEKVSTDVTVQETSPLTETPLNYRENAMRSITLLSTAAAILESQSVPAQERQLPTAKFHDVDTQINVPQYPVESVQPYVTPVYRAYVPTLNQYVTIPITMAPMPNPNVQNPFVQYLQSHQHRDAGITPRIPQNYPCYPAPITQISKSKAQSPPRQTTEQIRNLLTTNNGSTTEHQHVNQSLTTRKTLKGHKKQPNSISQKSDSCPLGEERRKQLEAALLSMDCCDINDSSTTMPFKCSDGVWRMVKFKCIRGLWVVQTPDSNTPTVYVPCDDHKLPSKSARKNCHKRKLSEELDSEIDSKRLCSSAPVLTTEENGGTLSSPPIKRTLSNPFITKSLPAPSQYFTNNRGKRVNISVVKRSTTSSSSDLIKSLLLRKPSPTIATSPFGLSSTSGASKPRCTHASMDSQIATSLSATLLKGSMAF